MAEPAKMMNVATAAEKAGCTQHYFRRLLKEGRLKGQKVSERCWLIPAAEVSKLSKTLTTRSKKYRE